MSATDPLRARVRLGELAWGSLTEAEQDMVGTLAAYKLDNAVAWAWCKLNDGRALSPILADWVTHHAAAPDAAIPCPVCKEPCFYEAPETVHNGVGEVPIGPDAWECEKHGHVWWADGGEGLNVEHPDGRPTVEQAKAEMDAVIGEVTGPRGVRHSEPPPQMFEIPSGGAE